MLRETEHDEPELPEEKRAARFERTTILVLVTAVLGVAAFLVLWPLATPLILGAWAAHLARPLFLRLNRFLHGRERAAAVLSVTLVLFLIVPFVLVTVTLLPALQSLVEELRHASGGRGVLATLAKGTGASTPPGDLDIGGLVRQYGQQASAAMRAIATGSAQVLIGVVVFIATFFALLVDSEKASAWLEHHAPLDRAIVARFKGAFYEAGQGLLVGTGITALAQGAIATVIYVALGIPRALLLGMLSMIAALIPVVGPTIVWIPVAAGLAFSGEPVKAIILAALGVLVIGSVDNLVRPWLSKRAHVGLSTTLVLIAMFGGAALFGAWGLLLGPLVVRLAVEALEIARERNVFGRRATQS